MLTFEKKENDMEGKDLKWIYQTVLAGPGMDELVKLNFTASRKLLLLLVEVIEKGILVKGNGLLESVDQSLIQELKELNIDILDKGKLSNLSAQLKKIQ